MKEETVKCVIGLREKKLILQRKGQGIRNVRKKDYKEVFQGKNWLGKQGPFSLLCILHCGKDIDGWNINHEEVGLMQMDEYEAM